jgi:hypothetical protein
MQNSKIVQLMLLSTVGVLTAMPVKSQQVVLTPAGTNFSIPAVQSQPVRDVMREILKPTSPSDDAKLPDGFSNPNAPQPSSDYVQIQSPLTPGQQNGPLVGEFIGIMPSNGGPNGEVLSNNPDRIVSEAETAEGIRSGRLLQTFSFSTGKAENGSNRMTEISSGGGAVFVASPTQNLQSPAWIDTQSLQRDVSPLSNSRVLPTW